MRDLADGAPAAACRQERNGLTEERGGPVARRDEVGDLLGANVEKMRVPRLERPVRSERGLVQEDVDRVEVEHL